MFAPTFSPSPNSSRKLTANPSPNPSLSFINLNTVAHIHNTGAFLCFCAGHYSESFELLEGPGGQINSSDLGSMYDEEPVVIDSISNRPLDEVDGEEEEEEEQVMKEVEESTEFLLCAQDVDRDSSDCERVRNIWLERGGVWGYKSSLAPQECQWEESGVE